MTVPISTAPYVLMHYNDLTCLGEAFFLKELPAPGDAIKSAKIVYPDGSEAKPQDLITCKFCRKPLHDRDLVSANILVRAA